MKGGGRTVSKQMERRLVPRIVKLRLVSKYINARVCRTAESLSRIYVKIKLFEMPSIKWELKLSFGSSFLTDLLPSLLFFHFSNLFKFFLIETWCRLTQCHSYPPPQGTLKWINITNPGATSDEKMWSMWKEPGQDERKTWSGPKEMEWSSALLVPKTPPISGSNLSGQRALDRWAKLLETLGVFSALSGEHGRTDGPQLVPAALPLTTGKLSGVWERTPAVSA